MSLRKNREIALNIQKYILRSLVYYRKSHLAIFAGVAVAVTVIIGALAVSDSVRNSLLGLVEKRLGNITHIMGPGNYMPRAKLATEIREKGISKNNSGGILKSAPVLIMPGSAITSDSLSDPLDVNLTGIDSQFLTLFNITDTSQYGDKNNQIIPPGEAIINKEVATKLKVKRGDTIILRISQPSPLPDDIPLAPDSKTLLSLRITVNRVADNSFPSEFSLKTEQQTPLNIFVSLDWLGKVIKKDGLCNAILAEVETRDDTSTLNNALTGSWQMSDIGLTITSKKQQEATLRSDNIFINNKIAKFALSIPGSGGTLAYFVNSFTNKRNGRSTPYSFAAAINNLNTLGTHKTIGFALPPPALSPLPGIIISRWLADDLAAEIGDTISLKYYRLGRMRKVEEKSANFAVTAIIPTHLLSANDSFKLDLPGLTNSENCTDWDPGIPINLKKIRDKDEAYWDNFKTSPKALISLKKGDEIWSNEFGSLTAVSFSPSAAKTFKMEFKSKFQPADFGLRFINIRKRAEIAAEKSIDFGQLFLGLSFFIIFSALILTSLLIALSIQARKNEIQILSCLGFQYYEIRRIFLFEHSIPAVLGAIAGVPLGMLYNCLVVALLNTIWKNAVGTSQLTASLTLTSAFIGLLAGLITIFIIIWLVLTDKFKNLRSSQLSLTTTPHSGDRKSAKFAIKRLLLTIGILFSIIVIVILCRSLLTGGTEKPAAPFFAAGGLLLIALWCFTTIFLFRWRYRKISSSLALGNSSLKGICSLAMKNCSCNIKRTLSAIILLSCGLFITLAVAVNLRTSQNLSSNSSGTGGYTFFLTTTLPIIYDLTTAEGQNAYNLPHELFNKVQFLQMPMHGGSDASCLNLNRVEDPAILGVDFAKLAKRKSFTFTSLANGINATNPWLLNKKTSFSSKTDIPVPSVADTNVIIWILGKNIGSTMAMNDENGEAFKLNFIGGISPSVFQGYVLIPIEAFKKLYPSNQGTQALLIACPANISEEMSKALKAGLSKLGVKIERCPDRVNRFLKVENTYLTIFLILGGLGVILGATGFGIVVIRNILERERELAIMSAIGYSRKMITAIITVEHLFVILAGIFIGGSAAAISAISALISARAPIPWEIISAIIATVLICGTLSVYIATILILTKKRAPL